MGGGYGYGWSKGVPYNFLIGFIELFSIRVTRRTYLRSILQRNHVASFFLLLYPQGNMK